MCAILTLSFANLVVDSNSEAKSFWIAEVATSSLWELTKCRRTSKTSPPILLIPLCSGLTSAAPPTRFVFSILIEQLVRVPTAIRVNLLSESDLYLGSLHFQPRKPRHQEVRREALRRRPSMEEWQVDPLVHPRSSQGQHCFLVHRPRTRQERHLARFFQANRQSRQGNRWSHWLKARRLGWRGDVSQRILRCCDHKLIALY